MRPNWSSNCQGLNDGALAFQFVFETDPQTVPQKGDHEMGFDSFGGEVPDWTDGKVAFESPENGFDFGELDVLGPKFGRIAPLQIGA
jgi:hypothetical protein